MLNIVSRTNMKSVRLHILVFLCCTAWAEDPQKHSDSLTSMIHGRKVSDECLTAYKALFVPEHQRVAAFQKLAETAFSSSELKVRVQQAAQAMTAYQTVLDTIDAKLAEALTMEDKNNLETTSKAQQDVGPSLTTVEQLVSASNYDGSPELKVALQNFKELRKVELKVAAAVDAACPEDLE